MDIFSLFVNNHCIRISAVVCKKVIWCWCRREILIYIIFVSFLRYIPLLFVVLLHAKTSDLINLCCVNNVGYYPLKMGELWGLERWLSWWDCFLFFYRKSLQLPATLDPGIQHPLWLLWVPAHMHTDIHTSMCTCTNFNNFNVEDIEGYN